jgi:DNA-binding transcriptional LysR family regulator
VKAAQLQSEQDVGVRLFDRTSRTVSLTDEGKRFHAQVAPLLAGLEDAVSQAAGAATTPRGKLRINVDPWFARLLLAPRVRKFLTAYPSLSLELVIRDRLGDLVGEGFDAALRFGEPEPSALIARLLLKTRLLTCAAPSHLERRGTPKRPTDLAGGRHECLLFRDPLTGRPFPWEFHRGREVVEVPVSGRLIVNDLATLLSACAAGLGLAQVMELGLEEMLGRQLVNLFPSWSDELFPFYVFHPSRHVPPAKIRAFLDFVETLL